MSQRKPIQPESADLLMILPRVHEGPARLHRALEPHEVREHRNVLCPLYGKCLNTAIWWPSFSCHGCPRFTKAAEVDDARDLFDALLARRGDTSPV